MNFKSVYYIYIGSIVFSCICSFYQLKKLDRASKILAVLMFCALTNESAAFYLGRKYHNNLPLYSLYCLIEFFILCMYFNNIIDVFKKNNIGIYFGVTGVAIGLLDIIFVQHLDSFNSYFLYFEDLSVIGMSLFAFFRMLLKNDSLHLYNYQHFWFVSILVFFWCITFLNWGLYDYFNLKLGDEAWKLNFGIMIVGIITYVSFGCVFILFSKMKNINE